MARFDVYRRAGEPLLLDCQTDLIDYVETRVVIPLVPKAAVPRRLDRLNPVFEIDGIDLVLMTPMIAAVPTQELGQRVDNLSAHHHEIMNAIDMLLSGF